MSNLLATFLPFYMDLYFVSTKLILKNYVIRSTSRCKIKTNHDLVSRGFHAPRGVRLCFDSGSFIIVSLIAMFGLPWKCQIDLTVYAPGAWEQILNWGALWIAQLRVFNDGPWTHPSRGSGEDIFSKKEGGYGPPTPVALRACQKLDTGGHIWKWHKWILSFWCNLPFRTKYLE